MKTLIDKLNSPRRNTRDLSSIILGILLLALLFTSVNPNFINKFNLISLGQNLAPYAMLSLGVLMPISMGGTDLSVGAVCIGSAVFAGKLYSLGLPLASVIPIMILFASLIGLINGLLIAKRHIQPFIATLGTMMFVRGATAIFANTPTVLYPSGTWYNRIFSSNNGVSMSFLWVILFSLIIFVIYRKTKFGRYLISIGSCEKATRISGVDVDKYKILGYVGSGFMAGVAAVFWTSSFATVTVATGNGMELDAIAGVYIGGTSAIGGFASVFGSVLGSIMLVIIRSGLNFSLAKLNVSINSTYVTYAISGIIVVVAVLTEKTNKGKSKKFKLFSSKNRAVIRIISYILSFAQLVALFTIGIKVDNNSSAMQNTDEKKTICLAMKSEGNEFWDEVTRGAIAAGDELGYNVICRGTESEDASYLPKQREIVSTLLSSNPVGIGMATIADGFTDQLEEAYSKGINVVQFDSGLQSGDLEYINSSSQNPLKSFVKASNYDNAAIAAENVYKVIRNDIAASDKYVVGVVQHENSVCANDRGNGFKDTLYKLVESNADTKGKCEIIIEIKPSEANNAYKEALEYLFEKDARMIFCTNLTAATQCADAVQSTDGKYDGVKFAAFDTGEKIYEWLKSDSKSPLLGTVSQNPYMIGYSTAKTLIDLYEERETEEEIIVPGEWVTAETIK